MIIIKPYGGLCNRILALKSVYYLAKDLGERLIIIWQKDRSCYCGFKDIFDEKNTFSDIIYKVKEIRVENNIRKNIAEGDIAKAIGECRFRLIDKWWRYWRMPQIIEFHSEKPTDFNREEIHKKNCYIYSYRDFYGPQKFDAFTWGGGLTKQVNEIMSGKDYIVGVHIRRTDHDDSIRYSPTSRFINEIEEILDKVPNAHFYLATDDEREEEKIIDLFGDKIIVNKNKKLGRNTLEGMLSAAVDLLCLANTKYILGSYRSTFSYMAAQIGRIPLEIMDRSAAVEQR